MRRNEKYISKSGIVNKMDRCIGSYTGNQTNENHTQRQIGHYSTRLKKAIVLVINSSHCTENVGLQWNIMEHNRTKALLSDNYNLLITSR